MKSMFKECSSLEKLNLSNFNTNKVTDMSYIFFGCHAIKELNLPSYLKIYNVIYKNFILLGCSDEIINKIKETTKIYF